ncbi:unnamed protein product [Linum trigynum]|uniref:Uncharacterized protein n=1 Tax=Linum trigynum TaxID=586398 RepID=A0AAV2CKB2_9ROSI
MQVSITSPSPSSTLLSSSSSSPSPHHPRDPDECKSQEINDREGAAAERHVVAFRPRRARRAAAGLNPTIKIQERRGESGSKSFD